MVTVNSEQYFASSAQVATWHCICRYRWSAIVVAQAIRPHWQQHLHDARRAIRQGYGAAAACTGDFGPVNGLRWLPVESCWDVERSCGVLRPHGHP